MTNSSSAPAEKDFSIKTGISFQTKIFAALLLIAFVALAAPMLYSRMIWSDALLQNTEDQVLLEARLAAALIGESQEYSELKSGLKPAFTLFPSAMKEVAQRMTILDSHGNVLADTQVSQPETMDNHADRPEVIQAKKSGSGVVTRFSNTTGTHTIYAAVQLADGGILRTAIPYQGLENSVDNIQGAIFRVIFISFLAAICLALLVSAWLRSSLGIMSREVENISQGKSPRRLTHVPGKEFITLASSVNRMAQHLESQMREVKNQAAQLEGILESIDDGVLVLDTNGYIRSCNRALSGLFPALEKAVGKQVVEAIASPALQNALDNLIARQQEHEFTPEMLRMMLEIPNGRYMDIRIAPFRKTLPETPDSPGLVAVFHDITELKRLEKIRKDFVSNVSHELRTPLTAIQGYAETLAGMDNLSEEARNFAGIIQKHGSYLSRMVQDLLELSRLEQEEKSLPISAIWLKENTERAISLCQQGLDKKKLRIQADIPNELRVMAYGPSLVQVIRNVLENACRYAPEHSDILISAEEKDGNTFLHISDNGPGIPESDLPRIFERFYRVEKHRSNSGSEKNGTGLGLAISKHIMDKIHGRIWAESPAQNASTTFHIMLKSA